MATHPTRARDNVLFKSFSTIREVQARLAELVATKPTPAILAAQISLWGVLLVEVGTIRECLERGSVDNRTAIEAELVSAHDNALWRTSPLPAIQQASTSTVRSRSLGKKTGAN